MKSLEGIAIEIPLSTVPLFQGTVENKALLEYSEFSFINKFKNTTFPLHFYHGIFMEISLSANLRTNSAN